VWWKWLWNSLSCYQRISRTGCWNIVGISNTGASGQQKEWLANLSRDRRLSIAYNCIRIMATQYRHRLNRLSVVWDEDWKDGSLSAIHFAFAVSSVMTSKLRSFATKSWKLCLLVVHVIICWRCPCQSRHPLSSPVCRHSNAHCCARLRSPGRWSYLQHEPISRHHSW